MSEYKKSGRKDAETVKDTGESDNGEAGVSVGVVQGQPAVLTPMLRWTDSKPVVLRPAGQSQMGMSAGQFAVTNGGARGGEQKEGKHRNVCIFTVFSI